MNETTDSAVKASKGRSILELTSTIANVAQAISVIVGILALWFAAIPALENLNQSRGALTLDVIRTFVDDGYLASSIEITEKLNKEFSALNPEERPETDAEITEWLNATVAKNNLYVKAAALEIFYGTAYSCVESRACERNMIKDALCDDAINYVRDFYYYVVPPAHKRGRHSETFALEVCAMKDVLGKESR